MDSNLTPLEVCERLIAPLKDLGAIAGYHEKSPYGWRHGSQWRDAGDLPPRANRKLLAYARKNNLPLTPEHLILGATRAEIDALLDQMKADQSRVAAE